jgi:hypothetical protein
VTRRARAWASVSVLAAGLALAGAACVSPDVFSRDGGDPIGGGEGGAPGPGAGGGPANGSGGSSGAGGHVVTGSGGTTVTGAGGRVGSGGSTGSGGLGMAANYSDNFEIGDVADRYFWDSPTSTRLNPSSTPGCGDWAVVADGTTTNHMFSQRAVCSGPSWAAGGNGAWTDMRLQAKVQFPAGATTSTRIMLGVRFGSDRDQIYIEYTNDGKLKIRQKIAAGGAPSDTSISTKVTVPSGQWVTVALSVSGNTINAYLGEDRAAPPVITATAVGLPTGGIAFGTTGGPASFDDILVTPP